VPDANPLICRCYRIHKAELIAAIREKGLKTADEIRAETGASAGCGSCYEDVEAVLDGVIGRVTSQRAAPTLAMSQMRILVLGAIDRHVKPLFALNGIEVDVIGIEPDRVLARLRGKTVGTTLASILTLKWFMVKIMTDACGRKVGLIEMNILDEERPAASA